MIDAYVLVQAEVGKAGLAAQAISELPGVNIAQTITGPYDAIVHVTAEDVNSLGSLVVAKIQTVDGVTRTLTCPVVRF
ncbi:MAG: Lrp/AsnC family transcriptional regulator [Acidimicrobiia bacterium]